MFITLACKHLAAEPHGDHHGEEGGNKTRENHDEQEACDLKA